MTNPFWALSKEQLFKNLGTGPDGITEASAARSVSEQNKNIKTKSRIRADLRLFLKQFESPLVLLLVAAVILSAFLGETSDVLIILFILFSSGFLSFFQERNASRAVEKLQSIIRLKNTVIREGKTLSIPSDEIQKGDLLIFKSGDIIPADCYLLETDEIHVNEASLTGESYPVRKLPGMIDADAPLAKRTNCLWRGSSIVSGTAKAIVVQTGDETIFGSIIKSISTVTETAFEKGIRKFGFFLMQITIVLAISILVLNLLFHRPLIQSVLFALALAIGMTPELLPAIMTIAMSAGAKRMLDKKVIVKKLSSIQNLGEVNLLCSDKTGTLTEGIIKIAGTKDIDGEENEFVKKLVYLNAFFESGFPNPIDDAIRQLNLNVQDVTKLSEIPYDFIRKMLSIAVQNGNEKMIITKGALINILSICNRIRLKDESLTEIEKYKENIQKKFEEYSNDGFRVIAVCYKPVSQNNISRDDEKEMIFAGFVLMEDPLKEGIIDSIKNINKIGVEVKIITGDNRFVSAHVCNKLGFQNSSILTGPEIEKMQSEALIVKARDTQIFAEIEPQQKEMIVRALQKSGYVVAYIGDGINDVPAINAADAGISINNAVDVAREAADFVLLERDLSVLTEGIKEGRRTFTNTLKYILINTGATFGNMFSVSVASLMLPFLPMLPKQILLTNFITDFPYIAVSSDNVDDEQIEKPGKWNLKMIRNFMIVFGLHSSLFDIITFVTLNNVLKVPERVFQTGWFFESILTELCILFIIRTRKPFLKSLPGKNIIVFSLAALILTVLLICLPFSESLGLIQIPLKVTVAILSIIFLYVITADILKLFFFKRLMKE